MIWVVPPFLEIPICRIFNCHQWLPALGGSCHLFSSSTRYQARFGEGLRPPPRESQVITSWKKTRIGSLLYIILDSEWFRSIFLLETVVLPANIGFGDMFRWTNSGIPLSKLHPWFWTKVETYSILDILDSKGAPWLGWDKANISKYIPIRCSGTKLLASPMVEGFFTFPWVLAMTDFDPIFLNGSMLKRRHKWWWIGYPTSTLHRTFFGGQLLLIG